MPHAQGGVSSFLSLGTLGCFLGLLGIMALFGISWNSPSGTRKLAKGGNAIHCTTKEAQQLHRLARFNLLTLPLAHCNLPCRA